MTTSVSIYFFLYSSKSKRVVLITAQLGTFYRPGSIYEQMLGIDAEIDALLKQQIYNLNFPEHPLFHRDVLSPHPTGAAENGIGNNSENLEANSKPKHRIPRKPVPAF